MMSVVKNIKAILPVVDAIRTYDGPKFKGDLNAGITVGIMLIP